jgi:hypothetical protein
MAIEIELETKYTDFEIKIKGSAYDLQYPQFQYEAVDLILRMLANSLIEKLEKGIMPNNLKVRILTGDESEKPY